MILSKQMSTFQNLISAFFWIIGLFSNLKEKQMKIDFKSGLIHYLDHVWLLDPISPHTDSSVSPFTSDSSDRQAFFV